MESLQKTQYFGNKGKITASPSGKKSFHFSLVFCLVFTFAGWSLMAQDQ